ncbi:MAG: integrin alpha [Anaerolineae bacterium]|nr:integrin alpha [Anaerolineae bacterium]
MKYRTVWLLLCALCIVLAPGNVLAEGGPPGLTGGFLESSTAAIHGTVPYQSAGYAVAIAGDVNGDGFDDVLVGAHGDADAPGYTGRVWLFLGGREGWHLDLSEEWADTTFEGEAPGDWTGYSVAGAGDINDDGFGDILIGAPRSDDGNGKAYLVFGRPEFPGAMHLGAADAIFSGGPGELAGWSVAAAGDMNGGDTLGNSVDDLLIGARSGLSGIGKAYLVLGRDGIGSMPLSDADAVYVAEAAGDLAGHSVAGAGDVNGDGFDDLLIGAPEHSSGDGAAYLILGHSISSPANVNLSTASRIYSGYSIAPSLGFAVSGAGDVNADGFADILVSFTGGTSEQGGAYLVLGRSDPKGNCLLDACSDEGYRGADNSNTGGRVSGVGDVNGDGYEDLLIGACGYTEGDATGRASLVLGHPNPDGVKVLSTDADAHYVGMAPGEQGCITQAGAGDINGDGLSDLVIGSPGWGQYRVGKAYVVFADGTSSPAARYRAIDLGGRPGSKEIGQSGVTVLRASLPKPVPGSVYVTRHFVDTCATRFATNGLLWTVEHYGVVPGLFVRFTYNDYQISGWDEPTLKLWYRDRPCQEWAHDVGATLDVEHNRIITSGGAWSWSYREYTIAPEPLYLYLPLIMRE